MYQTLNVITPSPSIPSWQLFSSATFYFQYPPNWISDASRGGSIHLYNPTTATKGGNQTHYKQDLQIKWFYSSQTADNYVDTIQKKETSSSSPIASQFSRQVITVNGLKTVEYIIRGEGVAGAYLVISNGNTIVAFGPLDSYPSTDSTINSVIQSFKFTQ